MTLKNPLHIFNYRVIENKASGTCDIYIDGDIVDASTQSIIKAWFGDDTSVSYKSFRDEVLKTDASVYNVYINSQGGHVGDAMAIHDYLKDLANKGKTVNTIGRGIIASSATLILLASENPEMSENSMFMMHTVSGGIYGNVDQIENYAKTMRKFNNMIRDLYSNKTGLRKEDISQLMNNETWLTAKEAKDKGFITNISGTAEFNNRIEPNNWLYQDQSILNHYNMAAKAQPIQNDDFMKKFFSDLQTSIVNAFKSVKLENKADGTPDIDKYNDAIVNALTKPFENIGENMESHIADTVKNQVTEQLKNQLEVINGKITGLEQKNTDLENEIANKIGNPTNGGGQQQQQQKKPVGNFN